jgi:hypothetical protein
MKQAADEVLAELGIEDENLEIAKRLEEIALKDEYFIEKKLYPNVDFYSGIILKALGHPNVNVHGDLCHWPNGGLDRALERNDRRRLSHRPASSALYRGDPKRFRPAG